MFFLILFFHWIALTVDRKQYCVTLAEARAKKNLFFISKCLKTLLSVPIII